MVDEAELERLTRPCTSGRAASPRTRSPRDCPVSSAISPSTVSRMCRRSLAWISISTADPPMPAEPWCIRTPGVRQREALARRTGGQQELPRAAGESECHCRHVTRHQPHHVADGEHRRHGPAERVDPQRHIGIGILGRQGQDLRCQQGPVVVVQLPVEHHDPLPQQLQPRLLGEQGDFHFISHEPTLTAVPPTPAILLAAGLLTADRSQPPLGRRVDAGSGVGGDDHPVRAISDHREDSAGPPYRPAGRRRRCRT